MKIDANEVWPYIWVGSAPPPHHPLEDFSLLALCATEHQPAVLAFQGEVVRPAFKDNTDLHSEEETARIQEAVDGIASMAADSRHCLVTCMAGLNRSAFVAALAMSRLEPNLKASQVIATIRRERSGPMLLGAVPLSNEYFVRLLRKAIDNDD